MEKRELFLKEKNGHPILGGGSLSLSPGGKLEEDVCVCVGGALRAEVSRVISVWGPLPSCSV